MIHQGPKSSVDQVQAEEGAEQDMRFSFVSGWPQEGPTVIMKLTVLLSYLSLVSISSPLPGLLPNSV